MRKTVVKLIDYCFQNEGQLIQAYDDSNTMHGLDRKLQCVVIGRYGSYVTTHKVNGYRVIFLPTNFTEEQVIDFILNKLQPDVVHMHGNHGWPQYIHYARNFRPKVNKMIFSPAGSSCGTPDFLSYFDHIIVNHHLHIGRMKTDDYSKIIIRHRAANNNIFYPKYQKIKYDFVYVAGFVHVKQIPIMIDTVMEATPDRTLVILGDFTRTKSHYLGIKEYISKKKIEEKVFLHDFIPQINMADFLGQCGVFVWPNIKPENPSTTTNRAVTEALACGLPLLLGERAFSETNYVKQGYNGFLYKDAAEFRTSQSLIFKDIGEFGYYSQLLTKTKFSYQSNFIDFYNDLYLS